VVVMMVIMILMAVMAVQFVSALFNDVVSIWDYIMSNDSSSFIDEWWLW
jgi:hypothetical protein